MSDSTIPESGDAIELADFVDFVRKQIRVSSILETGSLHGYTFDYLVRSLNPDIAVSVDLPGLTDGFAKSEQKLDQTIQGLREDGMMIRNFKANSHDQLTIDAAAEYGPFDLVYIDGDHSYEGAKQDHENYPGKIVAFHDIANQAMGVSEYWHDIKDNYLHIEFCEHNSEDKRKHLGIGVLYGCDDR